MINDKIRIEDININYIQYGSGKINMVLLHGWGQNIKMMMPIANAFKSECQKINIPMNVVLEIFMDEFANGKVDIIFKRQADGEFDGSLEYRL